MHKERMENFNEILNEIIEPINDSLSVKVIEERLYSHFGEIENKREFLKYIKDEYLPFYKDKIKGYEDLFNDSQSGYYKKIVVFESKKYRFIENWLNEKLKTYFTIENPPTHNAKTFPEYLRHNNRELIAERIKKEFSIERGKYIKLLLIALEKRDLISLGNRQIKAICESLKGYLNRNIGSYQSINDYKYDEDSDKQDFENTLNKLDFILKQA